VVASTIDRHDNRMVRPPALQHRHRAGLRKTLFPAIRPVDRDDAGLCNLFVGYVARPVGAFIFGHYGGRIGHKAALIATLLLTGLATFAVALVPSYEQIGIWGAIIVLLLRFIQGPGAGGEWGGSVCCRWNGPKPMRIDIDEVDVSPL
jgi:hypothetical protein